LPELVHEIIQVHKIVMLNTVVEAFCKVVGHIVYLANGFELAPCPQLFLGFP
jgi:hypothetical protein